MPSMLLDRPEWQQQDSAVAIECLDLRYAQLFPSHAVSRSVNVIAEVSTLFLYSGQQAVCQQLGCSDCFKPNIGGEHETEKLDCRCRSRFWPDCRQACCCRRNYARVHRLELFARHNSGQRA